MKKTVSQLGSFNYRPEYYTAFIEMCWGLIIANPYGDEFNSFPAVFSPMKSICNYESVWGLFYFFIGVIAILAVRSGTLTFRKYSSLLLSLSFFSKSVLFYLGDGIHPGVTTYAIIALFHLQSFIVFMNEDKNNKNNK